jgi:hypothetical protein
VRAAGGGGGGVGGFPCPARAAPGLRAARRPHRRARPPRPASPPAGALSELALAGASCEGAPDALASLLRAAAAGAAPLRLLDVRGCPLGAGALDALCALLHSPHLPLATLRADVATRECAERVARAVSGNTTLSSLVLGGPAPEHVLSLISSVLSANAKAAAASPGATVSPRRGGSPAAPLAGQRLAPQKAQAHTPPRGRLSPVPAGALAAPAPQPVGALHTP